MLEKKLIKKIKWYKKMAKVPFYKKNALVKIEKYQHRLNQYYYDKNENLKDNSKQISTMTELLNASVNQKHRDYNKKRVLVIGALKYSNELSLYSNSILKALNYENIVLHFYDYDSRKLVKIQSEQYEQNENYKEILYTSDLDKLDASLYDISIQLIDVKRYLYVPLKKAKIAYAYLSENSYKDLYNEININFDGVIYTKDGMEKELYQNEILLPKFYLPFAMDLNLYERFEFKNGSKKIGFLADIKTIEKYFDKMSSLNEYFKDNNIVVEFSYIKSEELFQRECISNEVEIEKRLKQRCTDNVTLTQAFSYLLPPEVFEKNKDWDLFVYAEDLENYMYNPIQTLRAGKCALFPTNYKVASKVETKGCFKYSSDDEFINCIKNYVESYDNLYSSENILNRKNSVEKYSYNEWKDFYQSIITPKDLVLGDSNKILKDGMQFKEKNLYTKYNYYEGREDYEVKGKLIPVPCLDAGFGSILNKYVTMLAYAKEDEVYIPDWRVIKLMRERFRAFNDKTFWSFCYGKAEDENAFLKIFDLPHEEGIVPTVLYHSDLMYEKSVKESYFTEYNIEREPNLAHKLTSIFKDEEYFPIFRKRYHEVFKKHIKIKPDMQEKVDDFYNQYQKDKFKIGIHIRCDAHSDEWVNNVTTKDYDKYFYLYNKHIENILKGNNIVDDNWSLYIATDNDIALEYFKNKYPKQSCSANGVSRLTKEQEKEYEEAKMKEGKYLVGFELQQRRCVQDVLRDVSLAYDILFEMLVLSRCDYFIYQSSNVPMAVSYMNPDLKMVYAE